MNVSTIAIIIIMIAAICLWLYDSTDMRRKLKGFVNGNVELTPDQFMKYVKKDTFTPRKTKIALSYDCDGAFLVHDETDEKYYLFTGTKLFIQIQRLCLGHIDGPALQAIVDQHSIKLSIINFQNSGCNTMSELEEKIKEKYNIED